LIPAAPVVLRIRRGPGVVSGERVSEVGSTGVGGQLVRGLNSMSISSSTASVLSEIPRSKLPQTRSVLL
jgi:hypothetical protein